MVLVFGKTQYNTEANLTEDEFKKTFAGIFDVKEGWKLVKKYAPKQEQKSKSNKDKKK